MALDKDEQSLLLLTNRLLLDWISIAVDSGHVDRGTVERLVDFSAKEVIRGAPWLDEETLKYAKLIKDRLPPAK